MRNQFKVQVVVYSIPLFVVLEETQFAFAVFFVTLIKLVSTGVPEELPPLVTQEHLKFFLQETDAKESESKENINNFFMLNQFNMGLIF